MVEAAAIMPSCAASAPRNLANRGSTGFFDIVELSIASAPTKDKPRKNRELGLGGPMGWTTATLELKVCPLAGGLQREPDVYLWLNLTTLRM